MCGLTWKESKPSVGGRYPYPVFSPLPCVIRISKSGCDEHEMQVFDEFYIAYLKQGFLEKEGQSQCSE